MRTRPFTRTAVAATAFVAAGLLGGAPAGAATPALPGVGYWATASNPYAQITLSPELAGDHHLTIEYTAAGYSCIYPDIDVQVERQLRSAIVTFPGPGHCSDGTTTGSGTHFIRWTSTSALKVGAHGVYRDATVDVCPIADPTDCTTLPSGALGVGVF